MVGVAARGGGSTRVHRRDEPVAAAVRGLDEARRVRIVAERLAQLADRALEHGVADEHARPDRVEQLLLRDQPARPRGQVTAAARTPSASSGDGRARRDRAGR